MSLRMICSAHRFSLLHLRLARLIEIIKTFHFL